MRKSFTRFLSLLFVFCLFSFTSMVYAQEAQETVELYAGTTSPTCYNESNSYAVNVSVKDFVQLTKFDLELSFPAGTLDYQSYATLPAWTSTGTLTVTPNNTTGKVALHWEGNPITIGNNLKTDIIQLNFSLDNNSLLTTNSITGNLTWSVKDFWYTTSLSVYDAVNTVVATNGSIAITQNYPVDNIVTTIVPETCSGGQAKVKVTSPTGVLYSFNGGAFTSNNEFAALPGNTVSIKVKSISGGCVSYSKTVTVPSTVDPVTFTVNTTNPVCPGGDASVFVTAAGGTGSYTYYYNTSASVTGATTRTNFQFNVPTTTTAKIYYIAVQDANGCVNLADASTWTSVTVQDTNTAISVSSSVSQDVTCNGGNNGAATVTITPAAVYYVAIDGGTWTATTAGGTKSFAALTAGTHTVTAKTVSDCTLSSTSFTISQPNALQIASLTVSDTSCGTGNDGKIGVSVTGGSGTYTITIQEGTSTPTTVTGVSSYVFTGLKPTYYSLVATDANGCSVSYSNPNGTGNVIAVQKPTDIQFTVSKTNVLCYGGTATATITATGGTGSYIYTVDTATKTTNVFAGLAAGTHTATVENASGSCPVTLAFTITGPAAALNATIASTTSPTCADGTDGDITLNISGGTLPYKYKFNNGPWVENVGTVSHIAVWVGTHTITVTDANSCVTTDLVQTVTQETNSITVTSTHVILCNGVKDGTMSATVVSWAGGRTGQIFKYASSAADVYTAAGQTLLPAGSTTPTTFTAGTYYVGAIDGFGCKATPVKVEVLENAPVAFVGTIATTAASCYNTADGVIAITAKGGSSSGTTTPLQYAVVNENITTIPSSSWKDMPNYSSASKTYSVNVQVGKGRYKVSVRDINCGQINYPDVVVVNGYDQLLVDESKIVVSQPLCNGDVTGSINVPVVTGGNGAYKYTLYKGGVVVSRYNAVASGLFTGLATGTYTVKVEDATTCPSYTTTNTITITEPAKLAFTATKTNITCNGANDGLITINVTGGTYSSSVTTAQYSYAVNNQNLWVPFVGTSKAYVATQPGTFTIWVKDINGCTTTSTAVQILEPASISATVTVTKNKDCNSGGEVAVTAAGGWTGGTATSTFEYKLDNAGTYTTTNTFTGLAAGTHSVTVHSKLLAPVDGYADNAECVKVLYFTITQPDAISYNVSVSNVKCKGSDSGSLTVTVLGGGTASSTGGYKVRLTGPAYDSGYVWTGSTKVKTFTGLKVGMYTVRIMDNAGCELNPTVGNKTAPYITVESWEVQEPATSLDVAANRISNAKCALSADGSFAITATGGVAPYSFFTAKSELPAHIVLPGATNSSTWTAVEGSTYTMTTATAGTWIVWAKDANGCIVGGEDLNGVPVNRWRVQILAPDPITFAVGSTVSPTCNGKADGSIAITNIVGGTATYTVNVSGTSTANVAVNKTVTTTSNSVTVTGLPASAGFYTITVSDVNGCLAATATKTVNEPAAVTVALVKSEGSFTCPGTVEGWIDAKATGGTPGYKYRLYKDGVLFVTSWQTTSTFLVQVGHTYKVEAIDKDGAGTCTATAEVTINEPVGVTATLSETTCYSDAKASVIVRATGEAGRTFAVRYRLNTVATFTDWATFASEYAIGNLTFANVTATENFYYFEVKDDKGCTTTFTKSFVPTQHPLEVTTPVVTDLNATMTISGGISPYSYKVGSGPVVNLPVDNNTIQVVNLPAGQSTITVMDAHGCSVPSVVSVVPLSVVAEPATGDAMKNTFDVKLTFNRDVTGVATSTTVTGGTGTPTVTGSGKVYTVSVSGADKASVSVALSSGIKDLAGNTLSATTFTYTIGDNTAPTLVTWNPNGVTLKDNHPTFVLTFNEDIAVGTGSLKIVKKGSTTPALTMPVTSVSGKTATVTYVYNATTGGLDKNTDYYVLVDAGFVKDIAGNAFAGVASETAWTFKTGDFATDVPVIPTSLEYKVYPNPFVDYVIVDNASELTKVVVTNIAGQVVKEVVNPDSRIELNQLVSGVYFISLYDGNTVIKTVKIAKR